MKKILLLIFLAHSGLLSAQKDYTATYNSDTIINKGVRLHDAGKYDEAVKEYSKIAKTDPEFLRSQYEKSMSLSAAEKDEELKAHLENLYKQGVMKDFPLLYTQYGSYLSDAKDFEASEKIFIEGEKYQPNSANFLYNMAILYVRKKESQKAVDILKKIITHNPNHASSHYTLGLIAFENGKIVEGSLAMISYLAIAPEGKFAKDAILKLNSKFAQNFLDKNTLVFSASGDNFTELETILRNQLPLKNAYKVKSEFDEVATRQVQAIMEYAVDHKPGNGFFETTYLPWMADMIKKNQYEGFSYYMLLSISESLGKKYTAQKKKLTSFYSDYMVKDFWLVYAKRNLEHYGTVQDVVITYDGNKRMIGPVVNGNNEGKFKKFDDMGNMISELYFEAGKQVGIQKYYDGKGNLLQELTVANEKKDGPNKEYYKNGNVELVQNYKNDIVDGPMTTYYYNGGKRCEFNYANGERDGLQTCYYPNGSKKSELHYKAGKADGTYIIYNESGDITSKFGYSNDELDGDYLEYYDGKVIKTQGKYSKGVALGTITSYFPNGAKNSESTYVNGKISKFTDYYVNGVVYSEVTYDSKGNTETYFYADWKGNKYYDEKYKNGVLKSAMQYTREKPLGTPVNISKNPFAIYNYEGGMVSKGDLEKGIKNKEWQYFYSSNKLKTTETYSKGVENGLRRDYNKNGTLADIYHRAEDEANGVYEIYNNGVLSQTSYYTAGAQNGPYQSFLADGKVSSEGFIDDNKLTNIQWTYWQDGTVLLKSHYYDGELYLLERFDANGVKESEANFKNRTGNFTTKYFKDTNSMTADYVNGVLNGKYAYKDKFGNPAFEREYVNEVETNIHKSYYPSNKPAFEIPYYNGKVHGKEIKYDMAGNLKRTQEYLYGDEYGPLQWFFHNKKKMYECNYIDGILDGEMKYYNLSGEPILTIVYEKGSARQFIKMNASGQISEKVEIKDETAQIESVYPNGKKAMSFNLVKGNIEGAMTINSADGKPQFISNYKNNMLNGERSEYYANGQLFKTERFVNSDFDGAQEYFREDGKPYMVANYKNSELHGNFMMYENGKVTLTKKYNSDELVEITK